MICMASFWVILIMKAVDEYPPKFGGDLEYVTASLMVFAI